MSKNTSIALTDHFSSFVEAQVRTGRYGSVSDVVRAGLRLLEERETKLRTLRDALVAGERSGDPEPFELDAFLAEAKARRHRA